MDRATPKSREGPLFLLADDDQSAAVQIQSLLYPELYYIVSVTNPRHVLNYARRLKPKAIFLAEPLEYPRGGAAALLERLNAQVGVPVIVLTELWTAELADKWKRMGAADCLPHPTRFHERLELLRSMLQSLALDEQPVKPEVAFE